MANEDSDDMDEVTIENVDESQIMMKKNTK
jgi:hypothetical protein